MLQPPYKEDSFGNKLPEPTPGMPMHDVSRLILETFLLVVDMALSVGDSVLYCSETKSATITTPTRKLLITHL